MAFVVSHRGRELDYYQFGLEGYIPPRDLGPEAGPSVPKRGYPSRGGPIRPEARLSVQRRAYPSRGGAMSFGGRSPAGLASVAELVRRGLVLDQILCRVKRFQSSIDSIHASTIGRVGTKRTLASCPLQGHARSTVRGDQMPSPGF